MLPVAQIICYTLILGAAVLHYFHWRISSVERNGETGVRLTGWLTVGLVLGASHGLVLAATMDGWWHLAGVGWARVTLMVVLSVLCLVALVAERVDVPGDPALLGGALASLLIAASSLGLTLAPPAPSGPVTLGFVDAGVIVAATALVWIVLHRHAVALRVRRQLAVAVVLLTAGGLASDLNEPSFAVATAAIAAQLAAALVVCSMTQRLLRGSIVERQEQLSGAPAFTGRGARSDGQGARAAARGRRHPGGDHQCVTGDAPRPSSACVAPPEARVHAGRGA